MGFFAKLLALFFPFLAESNSAEILFAGDAMMHEGQIKAACTTEGTYDFSGYFSSLQSYVESADLAVINFEASLGGKPYRGYPCFSAPDEFLSELKSAGFDFCLLANNHILDRRDRGLRRTISVMDSLEMTYAGVWNNQAERDSLVTRIVDVNGFKVSILNYTYGTNGIPVQGDVVVDYIDLDKIASDVSAARANDAEIVAVCVHWGDEYKLLPNTSQKQLADRLIDLGVNMVIGGHPHVVQPMEMRKGLDGKPALLVYSLGNFVSNMKTDNTRGGAMLRVRLERDSAGAAQVASAAYSLVFTEPAHGEQNYRVVPAHQSNMQHAKVFRKNAEALFSKYNRGVVADSLFLQ